MTNCQASGEAASFSYILKEVDKMGEIRERWKEFIDELLADKTLNKSQAYQKVYKTDNMSSASASACKLLRKPKVREYYQMRQKELSERVNISQERVLEEYAKIAFTKYTDFLHIVNEVKKKQQGQKIEVADINGLTEDQKCAIKKIRYTRKGIEIELYDKMVALEAIGKHIGMFKERVEIEGLANSEWFKEDDTEKDKNNEIE